MPDEDINLNELGRTGLTRFGGFIEEEWLNSLKGQRKIKVYREMSDNDPVVGAIIYAIKMLIRQVDWRVDPASDSNADQEAAEFVEECMHDMDKSWHDTISEILSMLIYGWSYHEIVYKKRNGEGSKFDDGRIGWEKLPIRSQESLWEWIYDEEGELAGMKQQPAPDYKLRTIPFDKAMLFRTESFKDNPEGRSILRTAYRPWYFKKNIEEVEGIGIERDLAGLPVAEVPPKLLDPNASKETKEQFNQIKDIVTQVRRDEMEGVVFPAEEYGDSDGNSVKTGFKFRLLNSGGDRQFDTNEIIERYDRKIAMTVLADFIMLGHEKVGSFALASSKTDMFVLGLKAILDSICQTFNNHGIPKLIELNGFNVEETPELKYGDIETPDLEVLSKYIKALAGVGINITDDETENYLRDVADLPKKEKSVEKSDDEPNYNEQISKLQKRIEDDIREFEKDLPEEERTLDDCGCSEHVKKNEKLRKEEPDWDEWEAQHEAADKKVPEMSNKFLDTVDELKGELVLEELIDGVRISEDKAMKVVDWTVMQDGLTDFKIDIQDIVEESGDSYTTNLNQRLDLGISFDVKNPAVQRWIDNHSAELITQISDESKDAISEVIRQGYDKGYTNRQIAENVRDYIGLTKRDAKAVENLKDRLREAGNLTESEIREQAREYADKLLDRRSMVIARNETIQAAKEGARQSWKQAQRDGVIDAENYQRRWIITPDDRLCQYCKQMKGDRAVTGLNDPYDTPLGYKQTAHMHIQCRCAEVIEEKE